MHYRYIREELKKSKAEAASPDTQWLSHDEVWNAMRARHGLQG